jgi:hypothetical protein
MSRIDTAFPKREARRMASVSVDPAESGSARAGTDKVALGIALPLLLAALAYGLWWISDQLIVIGPLDRASFGWIVVIPLWLSTPVVAGFAWRSLGRSQARLAAFIVGACVSAAAALAFWQSIGTPFDCGFGTVTPATDFLPGAVLVGILVGGGLAIDGLLVDRLARAGVRRWAVVIGVGAEGLLVTVALFALVAVSYGHTCFVPGPGYPVAP